MFDLIDDLSKVTGVSKKYLNKFVSAANYAICDSVKDTTLKADDTVSIDIGIGTIDICLDNEVLKYRFIPSKKLAEAVRYTVKSSRNPLEYKLEETLKTKVKTLYKDLL